MLASLMQTVLKCVLININDFPKINSYRLVWENSGCFHTFCPNGMYQHDGKVTFTLCDNIVKKKKIKSPPKQGKSMTVMRAPGSRTGPPVIEKSLFIFQKQKN